MWLSHSNALLQFRLELEHCKPHKAEHHPTKCDVINDVKQFPTGIAQDILSQIFDIIQSDVALQKQVHQNEPYMHYFYDKLFTASKYFIELFKSSN